MVDLSNLKVGDTVHLRCGGSFVIEELHKAFSSVTINGWLCYKNTGNLDSLFIIEKGNPFDIISITPKPEPRRIKGWVNVYDFNNINFGNIHASKAEADKHVNRIAERIACIEIDVAEGEGL